jgi:TetR/AcrR family transcriptional regulator, lmrAB and yxaGH operons repressor
MTTRMKHRDAIVAAAVRLFRRRGYSATGLNDIVELSGAPKGSLYYYFPKGKLSIAEAAVRAAGQSVAATIDGLSKAHKTAGQLVRAHGELLAKWMSQSNFTSGCPMATTLLETAPDDAAATAAGREAFASWCAVIAARLVAEGAPADRAERLAALVVSAMEGALIQSRVEGRAEPILSAARELETLLDAAVREPVAS